MHIHIHILSVKKNPHSVFFTFSIWNVFFTFSVYVFFTFSAFVGLTFSSRFLYVFFTFSLHFLHVFKPKGHPASK